MRSINKTRSLVVGTAVVGALTMGAYAAAGHGGQSGEQQNTTNSALQVRSESESAAETPAVETKTVREDGIALEGQGTWRGQPVSVTVYENAHSGNSLQMVRRRATATRLRRVDELRPGRREGACRMSVKRPQTLMILLSPRLTP